jgi:hypothetical protein
MIGIFFFLLSTAAESLQLAAMWNLLLLLVYSCGKSTAAESLLLRKVLEGEGEREGEGEGR